MGADTEAVLTSVLGLDADEVAQARRRRRLPMSTPPAIAHSPKFHRDRSGYADALRTWFQRQTARRLGMSPVGNIDIPAGDRVLQRDDLLRGATGPRATSHTTSGSSDASSRPTGALFPAQTAERAPSRWGCSTE